MDGRVGALLLTQLLPAVLIGVTVWHFGANPVALLGELTVMVVGACYILSYAEAF